MSAIQMYATLPMSFEANAGQSDPRVKFLVHAPEYSLFLTNQEAVLSLLEPSPAPKHLRAGDPLHHVTAPQPQRVTRGVRIKFVGGSVAAVLHGADELAAKSNYFIGNDPKLWHTNVPNYSAVKYTGIYPGVDAVFHGDNRTLEFDFDIAAGADTRNIALEVNGARRMRLNRAGDVVLDLDAAHELVMNKPHIYQQLPEGRREIAGNYVLGARDRIAFALGAYDHTQPLVIDPTITYSTYLGGSAEDFLNAISADSSGSAYLAGEAFSPNFPVTDGAYQTSCTETGKATCTSAMAYVAKLSPDGGSLLYATFLNGHSAADSAWGIAVDPSDSAYVLGEEEGELDFPTTLGAFQTACNVAANMQPEVFVAKLDPTGSILDYSTCLQSPAPNAASNFTEGTTSSGGIAVDSDGNAYVTGVTNDPQDFPTTQGTFQTGCVLNPPEGCNVSEDPFVTKLSPTGEALLYSTFLSTGKVSSAVYATGIAVDSLGNAYVIGNSDNRNLITTPGSFMPSCPSNGCGGFVAKINGNATALVYSTYLGGSDFAYPTAVAVDQNGSAFVTGYTGSTDFPVTVGALQYYFTPPGALATNVEDGFVVKVGALGDTFAYSTFLAGTSQVTQASGIAVDAEGHAFVTGIADPGFPTTMNAFQTTDQAGSNQAFLSELDPGGASLLYSTFLAGTSGEASVEPADVGSSDVAVDASGNAYVAGITDSSTFPTTPGAYLTNTPLPSGSRSATGFVVKFAFPPTTLTLSPTTLPSGTLGVAYSQTLTSTGGTGTVTFAVSAGEPPTGLTLGSDGTFSGTPAETGTFPFTVTATDANSDTGTQAYSLQIVCPTITVSPATLAAGTSGVAYLAVTFTETGGAGTTGLSETGALPTGMNFVAPVLSGTPTQTGSFPINVTATDSNSCTGSVNPTLTINSAEGQPAQVTDNEIITVSNTETFPDVVDSEPITVTDMVSVTTSLIITTGSTLAAGTEGVPYSTTFAASGGSGTVYTWSIISGGPTLSLAGLTLSSGGILSGTPSASGTYSLVVQVADSAGNIYSANFSLAVSALAPIANLSPGSLAFTAEPSGTASAAQTVTLTNTGNAPLSFTGTGITISGANATDFSQTNQCPSSVAAGSNCPINVTFTPISPPSGIVAAELNVADNASGSPQQVGLSGIVLPSTSVSCNIPPLTLSADSATDQVTCAEDLTNPAPLGPIALVCNLPTSLSKFITCSFSPNSLNFTSATTPPYTASTTLTIQKVQKSVSLGRKSWPWAASSGGVAFGAVLWLPAWLFGARRKKGKSRRGLLLLVILFCGLPMITSCIGKSGPATPPAGTYQASVVLTGPGLNETITFTIQEP
jgi:hypothetical protein